MPGTVQHVFSSPVADATGVVTYGNSTYNASDLIKPSDWNRTHGVTINAVGSEIINAFSNTPGGVSFGLETNGYVTGGAPAGGGGITNINVSAGTQAANLSNLVFLNSSGVGGVGGVSFGLSASSITASVNAYPIITDSTTIVPNGFPNRSQFTYSWSDATRTLTITPVGAEFVVWSNGKRYVKNTAQDFVFADTEGRQYAYFDSNGDPQTTTTFSTDLILRWAITGILYWDATNNVAVPDIQVEYHGTDWPPELHLQQHLTVGCVFQSGLDLTLTPDQDGSSLAHIEFAGAQGYVWDEDIQHNIAARLASANTPILYKTGASLWRYDASSPAVVRATGTGRAAWNKDTAGTWSLEEMTEGYFGVANICVGSGLTKQWFVVMGAAEYATLDEATTAAKLAPDMTGLPFQEFRIVGAVVFETSDTFTNAVKSRIRYMTDGTDWVDWRTERTVASAVSSSGSVQIVAGGETFANGPVSFGNSNGFSFITNNGSIVGSYTVPSVPAQSVQPVAVSGSNGSFAFSTLTMGNSNGLLFYTTNGSVVGSYTVPAQTQFVLSDSNGVSFGTNGSTVTASVKTDYAGSGFTGVNATGTLNSNGLSLSVAAGGGGADGYNIIAAGTQTANTAGTVAFLNSNGISFGMTNSSQITASYTVPAAPTSYLSNVNGSSGRVDFAVGSSLSSSQNGSTVTWGLASNITTALQSAGAYLTTARASNDAIGLNSALTANGVSATINSSGLSLNFPAFLTTAQPVGAYLTTARASNDALGLNTALTANGLSVTANSSGLSINVPAWLTTAANSTHSHGNPALALTNINGTTASASNGLTLSLSAIVPVQTNQTGNFYVSGNTTQLSSTAGLDLRSVSFEGAGIASVGVSNGRVLVSVPSGGGAGDGYNILAAGGATAGTAATIQFSNANGVSFGLDGSTITASVNAGGAGVTYSGYCPYGDAEHIAGQVGQGTIIFDPNPMADVQWDRIVVPINCTNSSNSSGSHTISYWLGIYSQNDSTLSLWGSTSTSIALTHSGTAGSYSWYSGMRLVTIPWTTTIPAGNYWFANLSRTTSGGANGSYSQFVMSQLNSNFLGHFGSSHNTTQQSILGHGVYTVTSNGIPASVAFSQIQGSGALGFRAPKFYFASGTV